MNRKKQISLILLYIFLGVIAVTFIIPYLYIVITSTQNNAEILSSPPKVLPSKYFLENLLFLFERYKFIRVIFNTLFISVVGTIIGTLVCSMAGYALEKYEFKGKKVFFNMLMFTTLIPGFTTLIPMFIMFSSLNLTNSYLALILPGLAYAGNIFMMRQFMQSFPKEIIEAGRVDGLSELEIFFKLVLPIMMPSVMTAALMIFVGYWNSYLWPLVIINKESMFLVSMVIKNISAQSDELMYGVRMLLAAISIIPILILYVTVQKRLKSTGVAEAIK